MILFELTMPNAGSWNKQWSGADRKYYRTLRDNEVPQNLVDKYFWYDWHDGWSVCISTRKVANSEGRKLMKQSSGFSGYDWMISSILKHGEIRRQDI